MPDDLPDAHHGATVSEPQPSDQHPRPPPGTFVRRAESPKQTTRIVVTSYDADQIARRELASVDEVGGVRGAADVTWVHVEGLSDAAAIAEVSRVFGLHPLVTSALSNKARRPRLDDYGDHIVVTMRVLRMGEGGTAISEPLTIVLGAGYVLTLVDVSSAVLQPIHGRLAMEESRMRRHRADYLAYRIIDVVVDHYYAWIDQVGDRLEEIDERLMDDTGEYLLPSIYKAKRQLIVLRKAVWPLREVVQRTVHMETTLIQDETRPFLRDAHDHVIHAFDSLSIFREMVAMMVDLHLNVTSNRMNEVMKVLTVISTIFIPLSFLAGLYGMNFANMPELQLPWAYFALLGVMAVVAGGMLLFFRRRGWF